MNIESSALETDRQLQELISEKEKLAEFITTATTKVKDSEEKLKFLLEKKKTLLKQKEKKMVSLMDQFVVKESSSK